VWSTPGDYYDYEVLVNSDGSFTFKVVSTIAPYPVIFTQNVAKASWLTNLHDVPGYLTVTSAHNVNDGGSWSASTFHVDEVDMWQ
jgi:hypothetical protein